MIPKSALLLTLVTLTGGLGLPSQEQALRSIFPRTQVETQTIYLTAKELKEMKELVGAKSKAVHRVHTLSQKGVTVGIAVTDVHRVRSKKSALVIGSSPSGKLTGVRVIGFQEPKEYLPSQKWLAQFQGKELNKELHLKKGVDGITGATLTSRATVLATRRALALQSILKSRETKNNRHDPSRSTP
ncbi:MAG: FMN-binding protein [Planctomycetota bacterium]|nr:FMN-binding protein [Planctomycetota bacterium]